jgi:hypothetical protein
MFKNNNKTDTINNQNKFFIALRMEIETVTPKEHQKYLKVALNKLYNQDFN